MWEYSTTTATSAQASRASSTASGSTFSSTAAQDDGVDYLARYSTVSQGISSSGPYEATYQHSGGSTSTVSDAAGGVTVTGSSTGSSIRRQTHGFTHSETRYTTDAAGGVTTSSSIETTTRSRDSYRSTTVTETTTTTAEHTTTQASTRSLVTTAAGPTTTTTTEDTTITTSTTAASNVTRTTYAWAASTTLSVPESLVPISEVEPTEQGWEITATTNSAGYVSHLGTTFTKRTGTAPTISTTADVTTTGLTYSTTQEQIGATSTFTLTTTLTLSIADTFAPFASVYPATATSTRAFTMLSTTTTTLTRISWTTSSAAFTGPASLHDTRVATTTETTSALAAVTINVSPTATTTAEFHVTWSTTRTRAALRIPATCATSHSATVGAGSSETYSTTTTGAEVTTTSTASSSTDIVFVASQFATDTCAVESGEVDTNSVSGEVSPGLTTVEYYSTSHDGTNTFVEATGNATESFSDITLTSSSATQQETATSEVNPTNTASEYSDWTSSATWTSYSSSSGSSTSDGRSVTHEQTSFSSSSRLLTTSHTFLWSTVGFFSTSSSSTTSSESDSGLTTFSTSFLETATTWLGDHTMVTESWYWSSYTALGSVTTTRVPTATVTIMTGSGSSYTQRASISYTWLSRYPQATIEDSAKWTAHQMHPRQGFRHPLSLVGTDTLFSAMSLNPSSTIYFPPAGTQDDSSGAVAPKLDTGPSRSTNGASVYSAVWRTSNSRLAWSSATTATYTTTQQHGAATATLTKTSSGATATGTASFSGVGPQSWFSAQPSSAASLGSKIGGIVAKSEYGAALYSPPGVRHFTHQQGGTVSSSATTWLTSVSVAAASSDGYALPTRSETAISVSMNETTASITHDAVGAEIDLQHPRGGLVIPQFGNTSLPAITLSLHPDL